MLKDLYNAIRKDSAPNLIEVDGRRYSDKSLYPVALPTPSALEVGTLTGFMDYCVVNYDGIKDDRFCVVEKPDTVCLYSTLFGEFEQRKMYIKAKFNGPALPLDDFYQAEEFNILVQSNFVDSQEKETLLRYVSNIKSVSQVGLADDGKAQCITVKKGISAVGNDVLPNPVVLAPYRTFAEIEQPSSTFIFRVRENNGDFRFMLKEADGGNWKNEAMKRVQKYLQTRIIGIPVLA